MIQVTSNIAIEENELQFDFIRSSGPGGQNVNKVSTAVQLRFDIAHSPSLTDEVRERLKELARARINQDGVLVIEAKRQRTQGANRQDAINRLVELIQKSAYKPPVRHATKPTLASKQKRLQIKRRRSETKQLRRSVRDTADE